MPISCIAAELRGQLKHTFLENTVLALSEPLLRLHLAENSDFVKEMTSINNELIARLVDDYDPGNLIARLAVLDWISDVEQSQLKERVHERYVKVFRPEVQKASLSAAWARFADALTRWNADAALEAPTAQAFSEMQTRAQEYHRELDSLSRGVWLG